MITEATFGPFQWSGISQTYGMVRFKQAGEFFFAGLNQPVIGKSLKNPETALHPVTAIGPQDALALLLKPFSKYLRIQVGFSGGLKNVLNGFDIAIEYALAFKMFQEMAMPSLASHKPFLRVFIEMQDCFCQFTPLAGRNYQTAP
jgi:hypothetical protein